MALNLFHPRSCPLAHSKTIRDQLNQARSLSKLIHEKEQDLICLLYEIDQKRYYVRYGFNSLTGFCRIALQFSKTQTQRIVTRVRRYEPTLTTQPLTDIQL